MLTFRNTNLFFAITLALMIAADILYDLHFIWYAVLAFVYSLVLFYGCYFIQSNFFMKVICAAETDKQQIAISFDDGPVEHFTPQILSILKEQKVEAAFFCIGNRIAGAENILRDIVNDNHIVGNHSYSHHFFFDMYSSSRMLAELKQMNRETETVTGHQPKLFRPPYGVMNPNLRNAIINGGFVPVGWNVRSLDTVIKDENKLFEKMMASLKPGAVFLFHDTSNATVKMLPKFINSVKERGYEFVRLDKMLLLSPYA